MNLSTNIVRFQIITIIVGLAIDKSIAAMLDKPSLFKTLCSAYFLITLLNFYHGKIATTEAETYVKKQAGHPLGLLLDYCLNVLLTGSFLFIAYVLPSFTSFVAANIAMRVFDLGLVIFAFWTMGGDDGRATRNAHIYWGLYDILMIAVLCVFCMLPMSRSVVPPVCLPVLLLCLGATDIVLDYTLNASFYFGSNKHG